MRSLLLLLLVALPARAGEVVRLSVVKETRLEDFLLDMAERCGWLVLCDPEADLRQEMGAGFVHEVPKEKLPDTVRAILAFFEVALADLGNGVQLAYRSPSTNDSRRGHAPPRQVRLTLLGLGGATSLDFEQHWKSRKPELRLLPATRDRLLLGLRFGLHAKGRAVAARLLGAIGPHFRSTADALARALDDEDAAVRLAAVHALARSGDTASHVVPRLRELGRPDDRTLRHAARVACRRLAQR